MWRGLFGSTLIECSVAPSGGASCASPIRVRRREPEDVRHALAGFAFGCALECGRRGGLGPGAAEILAAKDGMAEVARLHGGEQRAPVARIDHGVVHGLPEEMRPVHAPRA